MAQISVALRPTARFALAMAGLLLCLDAVAFDPSAAESLAHRSGCNKCYAVEKKKDGPALRDVAAKYKGDEHAAEKLIKHVTSGEMCCGRPRIDPLVKDLPTES